MSNDGRFITLDTESRSHLSVKKTGPWKYFEHPSTQWLCLRWAFGLDEEIHLWHRATEGILESPFPKELFRYIEKGWLVEAHNMMFERAGFAMMARRHGWPALPVAQLRCSAAKAAYHTCPRSLEGLAEMLRTKNRKDPRGEFLIDELSTPHIIQRPKERKKQPKKESEADAAWRKANEEIRYAESMGEKHPKLFWMEDGNLAYWNETESLIRENWDYCAQDVRTEREASLALPDLPERELAVWQMDQEMNARGIQCDLKLAKAAIEIARVESEDLNFDLKMLTGIDKATQKAAVKDWLNAKMGWEILPNMTKETVDAVFARPGIKKEHPIFHEVLSIYRKVNRSSLAKYSAMIERSCDDERLRDTLMYCGALTLRWAAKGVQPHNMPRGVIKYIDVATEAIKSRDRGWMRFLYKDIMTLLSHSLRGAFIPAPGKRLYVADFSAIEARITFWLANCLSALEIFERDEDIYCTFAESIYGYPVTKETVTERKFGKEGILSLGFGMGFCKFFIRCKQYGIRFSPTQVLAIVGRERANEIAGWIKTTGFNGGFNQVRRAGLARSPDTKQDPLFKANLPELVLAKYVVDLYRVTNFPEVPTFWKAQESAAVKAVDTRGVVECGKITWEMDGRRLLAHLPTGRDQTYWDPRIPTQAEKDAYKARLKAARERAKAQGLDPNLIEEDGEHGPPKLRYTSLDEETNQPIPVTTYGGKITENLVSHTARDIMADAMLRIEEHPDYDNILTVHDEPVAEADVDGGNLQEFRDLVRENPPYALDCPIDAEAWTGLRYKKA